MYIHETLNRTTKNIKINKIYKALATRYRKPNKKMSILHINSEK